MKIQDTHPRPLGPAPAPAVEAGRGAARSGLDPSLVPGRASAEGDPAVRVDLSARSRELAAILAAARSAPDLRAERLAAVRRELEAGTYRVDPVAVARAMLERRP
jgi:negative regulator of flagellin synthesis FlgM